MGDHVGIPGVVLLLLFQVLFVCLLVWQSVVARVCFGLLSCLLACLLAGLFVCYVMPVSFCLVVCLFVFICICCHAFLIKFETM